MKKARLAVAVACALAIGLAPVASMAVPINLTETNDPDLGLAGVFGTVNVELTGANTVMFTVDANEALLGAGDNFGIQTFGFNSELTLSASDFVLPTGWGLVALDQNLSDFGIFDYDLGKKPRQDPLVFSITNSLITSVGQFYVANSDGYHYVAHIAGFTNGGTGDDGKPIESAWFGDGTSVPEPGTLLLLGTGLLGAGLMRRRRD